MRRDERKAAKKPANKLPVSKRSLEAMSQIGKLSAAQELRNNIANAGAVIGIDRSASPSWQNSTPMTVGGESPGRGEIVGGEVAKLADTLVALARKKGGTDAVQAELAALLRIARYEGQKAADDRHMKTVKDLHEAHTDKIVCSAIAAFQMQMKEQGGLPPAVTISSYTLCRMLDALNRAGYSAEGRRSVGQ